jgi:hypothetical protein
MTGTYSVLPFPAGDYYFEQPWTLSGVTYILTMRFNHRVGTWFMDIADATGANIVCGIALRQLRDLLGPYRARNVPVGALIVFDQSGSTNDPGADDFSLNFGLYYIDPTA